MNDNPALTTRFWPGNNPVRLVIDNELQLPSTLYLFDRSVRTIVFNTIKQEENENLSFYKIDKTDSIKQVLKTLYELKLQSVIVEGGAKLLQSFIDEGYWDEARVITNISLQIEKGIDAPKFKNEILLNQDQLLNDSIGYYTHGR